MELVGTRRIEGVVFVPIDVPVVVDGLWLTWSVDASAQIPAGARVLLAPFTASWICVALVSTFFSTLAITGSLIVPGLHCGGGASLDQKSGSGE